MSVDVPIHSFCPTRLASIVWRGTWGKQTSESRDHLWASSLLKPSGLEEWFFQGARLVARLSAVKAATREDLRPLPTCEGRAQMVAALTPDK